MAEYDKHCFNSKEKPKYVRKKKNTYCIVCEKKTDKNIKGVVLQIKQGNKNQRMLTVVLESHLFKTNKTNKKIVFTD